MIRQLRAIVERLGLDAVLLGQIFQPLDLVAPVELPLERCC
ncbi:hypothetical protein [Devosia sp. 1635]|nr:hypothetical protein [Devosia sp. 1635]